jgi:hypothetical protein
MFWTKYRPRLLHFQRCGRDGGRRSNFEDVDARERPFGATVRRERNRASNDEVEKPVAQPANSGLKATQLFKISRFAGQILQRSHSFGEIC